MSAPDISFRLYGTVQSETPARRLQAGRLSADLSGGALRAIRYDGVEVVRAISFLVRDRDWGTYEPAIDNLDVAENAEGFAVRYMAQCDGPDGMRLTIEAAIDGFADGRLVFSGTARSSTGFETNRCGFCVLHPIVGVAGTPVRVEHVDGRIAETRLPDLIEPWQPFMDMRAITHSAMPGVTVECRMEGDTFEMEDQRNWSDASFKTYVRPLALPWPYSIAAGETVSQRIVLTIADSRVGAPVTERTGRSDAVHLSPGRAVGALPAIGLVVTPDEAEVTGALLGGAFDPKVQDLLFHFDPLAGHDETAFARFAAVAARHSGGTTLELALPCRRPVAEELQAMAGQMRDAGFRPDAIVVSPSVDRQSTPPGSAWPDCPPLDRIYEAARAAFPGRRLGGGMLSYFTELNRKRVPAGSLDVVSHCTNPIVHASDDVSVMQTLEALPFITRSVRAIYGDMPYRIGPSTLAMRQNPYGSRTMDNPHGARIPMANRDPRHAGLFAAAYATGYAIRVAVAGLDMLTLSAMTGSFGLIAGVGEPVAAGGRRPLFHAVQWLAALAGAQATPCVSSRPEAVLAMGTEAAGRRAWLVVNLTPAEQAIGIAALDIPPGARITRLDAETMTGDLAAVPLADGALLLDAFAVARIDG